MRKVHLCIHLVAVSIIGLLLAERIRSPTSAELNSTPASSAVKSLAPWPGAEAIAVAARSDEAALSERSEEGLEFFIHGKLRNLRLLDQIRGVPADLGQRRDRLWLELQDLGDNDFFKCEDAFAWLNYKDVDKIRAKCRRSHPEALPLIEKITALKEEYDQLAQQIDSYNFVSCRAEWALRDTCDLLTDEEVVGLNDSLKFLMEERQRLMHREENAPISDRDRQAFDARADLVRRDFAALRPRKPSYEEWLSGNPGQSGESLAEAVIDALKLDLKLDPAPKDGP